MTTKDMSAVFTPWFLRGRLSPIVAFCRLSRKFDPPLIERDKRGSAWRIVIKLCCAARESWSLQSWENADGFWRVDVFHRLFDDPG
jgi:hypothetical protein